MAETLTMPSSIFVRPDSPPPRQPSPDFLPAPLPCPHQPRRIASQPKIRVQTPTIPPGLHPSPRTRTLQSARSCDVFPRPSKSVSPPAPDDFVPHHRRTLPVAFATPGSSRSVSPTVTAVDPHQLAPAPVPYRYTGPQHIICPTPVPLNKPILFSPDEIHLSVPVQVVSYTPSPPLPEEEQEKPKLRSDTTTAPVPPLEKHKSMGIACLKFFGIRSGSARQSPPRPAMTAI